MSFLLTKNEKIIKFNLKNQPQKTKLNQCRLCKKKFKLGSDIYTKQARRYHIECAVRVNLLVI